MYIYWKNARFVSKKEMDFEKDILSAQLLTVPAAPSMVESKRNPYYYKALENATYSIIDSGLFSLLCKFIGIKTHKYSGYRLISDMLEYMKYNKLKLFVVSPRSTESEKIKQLLLSQTKCKEEDLAFYNAPMYPKNSNVVDEKLLKEIKTVKPDLVMLCVAGGKQEILGNYLISNLENKSTIICTGAAISFFTGSQAQIPAFIDKMYLGWLARIFADPKTFLPRYLNAFKFIFWFFKFRSTIKVVK